MRMEPMKVDFAVERKGSMVRLTTSIDGDAHVEEIDCAGASDAEIEAAISEAKSRIPQVKAQWQAEIDELKMNLRGVRA